MDLIRLENVCKTYYLGEVEVPALARRVTLHSAWRDGRADGRVGLRQNHLDEYSGLPGPSDFGAVLVRRRRR